MTLEAGTTIGRYQILGTLGHGGMASVYKAFQPALERVVALKVLRPAYAHDPEFLERFRREALAIARLRHPHIVEVHDFDEAQGLVFLAAYIRTMLQRDVRDISQVEGLAALPTLLALLAARASPVLNMADLGRGVDLPYRTLVRYVALLETIFFVGRVPAWSRGLGGRLTRHPKVGGLNRSAHRSG